MGDVHNFNNAKVKKLEEENQRLREESEALRAVLDLKIEDGDMTVLQGREYVSSFGHEGVNCPVCQKLYKIHTRTLESLVLDLLTLFYAETDHEGFVTTGKGETTTLLRFWGFIESGGLARWRLLDKGRRWIEGDESAYEKAQLGPKSEFYGFVGKEVTIHDLFSPTELKALHRKAKSRRGAILNGA